MHVARVISWLLVVAILIANHVHLAALQVPAWAGMLVNYSRGGTVVEALAKTFDGKHPCCVCKAIEQAAATSASDAQLQGVRTDKSADSSCLPRVVTVSAPRPLRPLPALNDGAFLPRSLKSPPPTPPPIAT